MCTQFYDPHYSELRIYCFIIYIHQIENILMVWVYAELSLGLIKRHALQIYGE